MVSVLGQNVNVKNGRCCSLPMGQKSMASIGELAAACVRDADPQCRRTQAASG